MASLIILSSYPIIILSSYNLFILSYHHLFILLSYHPIILSSYRLIILSLIRLQSKLWRKNVGWSDLSPPGTFSHHMKIKMIIVAMKIFMTIRILIFLIITMIISLFESMKKKELRKLLTHFLKLNQSLVAAGQKCLTGLQVGSLR